MNFDPNPLFYKMCSIYAENKGEDKVIICNEGGSRSSKTYDAFHFIVAFCDHNRNKHNDIYILRDTLTNCRDFTMLDFVKCLKIIGIYDQNNHKTHPKPEYTLWGNNIYFRGLDDESNAEGYPSDIIFINEGLETKKSKVDGLKMRCRKLMIIDWNPKFTDHWCFDLEGQPNVFFTRTNYKNNKHLQKSIVKEIESYEPWEKGTYEVIDNKLYYLGKPITETHQPPPNKVNERTADEFRWKVYGLGLRGAMKGNVFNNVTYIDEFPDMAYTYGLDFGFTNDPTALVRHAEDKYNIYFELLCYQPIPTPEELSSYMENIGIETYVPITADSSDKYTSEKKGSIQMVRDLSMLGWEIDKVRKKKSIVYWIEKMKTKKIHIVSNHLVKYAKEEVKNYRWKEINGIAINQPVDTHNHFWDAGRYSHMAHNYDDGIESGWE